MKSDQLIPLEHHKIICKLTQNSGVFILDIIPIIKMPKDQNSFLSCFSKKIQCGNP